MQKKTALICAFAAIFCFTLCASDRTSPIPLQPTDKRSKDYAKYLIHVRPTLPASVTNDDPLTPYTEKIKPVKGFIAEWFFIHVRFPVYAPDASDAWSLWLDDIEVMVEVCIPGKNKKGQKTYVILQGKQKLNSVIANNETHNVRFFIPPYAIFRYIVGLQEKPDLKKIADEFPILLTIFWKGKLISAFSRGGKGLENVKLSGFLSFFEKLRDSKSNYYENVILPAEYTPWAARDLDRFESMKIEMGSK